MATTGQKWLIGCAVGCGGVMLLLVVGLLAVGFVVKQSVEDFQAAQQSREQLEEKVGKGTDFTPEPDGSIPSERMEVFLAVREATQDERTALVEAWREIPLDVRRARELEQQPMWDQLKQVFSITRSGFGLANDIGAFAEARNQELLDRGMGIGEYAYIYVIAYHSWLGHPVTDGPGQRTEPDGGSADAGGADAREGDGSTGGGGPQEEIAPGVGPEFQHDVGTAVGQGMARELYGGEVRKLLIEVLKNQQRIWSQATDDPEAQRWVERLQAEIDAMKAQTLRVPWQDGLPEPIEASLEPYRERLEATYAPAANPFELNQEQQTGFNFNF